MALEKTTTTEKTSDVSKPINVLVDDVAADDKTETDDNEENSAACDEENEREDTASEKNVDEPDGSNEKNENAEEEESKEVEESEEEESGDESVNVDDSGNVDDSIGDGNVGEIREDNVNKENPNPVELESEHEELGTRCMIIERIRFEEHPQFKHFFHMKRENNHKVHGMWMLLVRTAESRFREHTLISGLNCCNYPLDYKACGGTKFVKRHFKEGEPIKSEDVKEKLMKMRPHRDRLKMAVQFFLGSVVCAQTKVGKGAKNVLDFFQRAVDDLDFCHTFPWGRYSYYYMLKEISHTMDRFGGMVKANTLWPLPGFCVPLEILVFEAIPKLGNLFRELVEGADVKCLRMCKSTFKPNGMINKELGHETEKYLLDEIIKDEDDVDEPDLAVDSWDKRIDEGLSVFFKDMYDEDVAAREEQTKEIEDTA
ncbi:hypothetical protein N665_0906s0004 [Sinapis alba]|nr:hypothetical protein N665_0906s0004 [Sinapis alba]